MGKRTGVPSADAGFTRVEFIADPLPGHVVDAPAL